MIKQLVVVRRRAGQTNQEFRDHHYQVHGAIAWNAPSPQEKPSAYYQTHFFDSAYNNQTLAQPAWTGHNDSVELYFDDDAHMVRAFTSEYVRNTVGPDGRRFNDFVGAIAMMPCSEEVLAGSSEEQGESQTVVATYYVQALDAEVGEQSSAIKAMNSKVTSAFGGIASKIVANTTLPDSTNLVQYFQGKEALAPKYSAAYQVYLGSREQIPAFRKQQAELETEATGLIKVDSAFVTFGVRAVVFDQGHGIEFDKARQPRLP